MRYLDVDTTYLATAVSRIGGALNVLTGYPVLYGPPELFTKDGEKTTWYVAALIMATTDEAAALSVQSWTVLAQLIYKPDQRDFDPAIYSAMYTKVIQAFVYLQAHKRLVFDSTQAALKYLDSERVLVTLASLNQGGQPGFQITHRLPFRIVIQPE